MIQLHYLKINLKKSFLFRIFEPTLRRIRSASLGEMPRNPFSTEARIFFTGTSLGAIANFWADIDAFHFHDDN